MKLSTTNVLQLFGINQIVLLQFVFSSALYMLLLHPLKRFPGPVLWRVSKIPWMLSIHSGTIHRDLHLLHSVWGPVVRVAPNELSFVDAQAFQDIYGRRKGGLYPFPKDPDFYVLQNIPSQFIAYSVTLASFPLLPHFSIILLPSTPILIATTL